MARTYGWMKSLGWMALLAATACGGGGSSYGGDPAAPPPAASGSVVGTVKDDSGAGVGGALVLLSASGQTAKSTSTSADGAFSFNSVPVGVWQISVTPPDGFSASGFPTVTVTAGAQASVGPIVLTKVQAGQAPTTASVEMYNSAFSPQSVTIKAGGSVTWHNIDNIAHTATGTGFDTGNLNGTQAKAVTFATAGTYNYACSIHSFMTGKVVVLP